MLHDNTTIYCSSAEVFGLGRMLTDNLAALVAWIERNGLSMNMKKTQFMVLNYSVYREADVANLEIEVNDKALARCNIV